MMRSTIVEYNGCAEDDDSRLDSLRIHEILMRIIEHSYTSRKQKQTSRSS